MPGPSGSTDPGRVGSVCAVSCKRASSSQDGRERKRMMIRVLAQIVFRQVCAPKGRALHEPDRSPACYPVIGQTLCASGAGPCAPAASPDTQVSDVVTGPQTQAQALVVLFTE